MASAEDDPLDLSDVLSPEALAALNEFKRESTAAKSTPVAATDEFVSEDFGKSQFWVRVFDRSDGNQQCMTSVSSNFHF